MRRVSQNTKSAKDDNNDYNNNNNNNNNNGWCVSVKPTLASTVRRKEKSDVERRSKRFWRTVMANN